MTAVRTFAVNCVQAVSNFGKGIKAGWNGIHTAKAAVQGTASYGRGFAVGMRLFGTVFKLEQGAVAALAATRNFIGAVRTAVVSGLTRATQAIVQGATAVRNFAGAVRTAVVSTVRNVVTTVSEAWSSFKAGARASLTASRTGYTGFASYANVSKAYRAGEIVGKLILNPTRTTIQLAKSAVTVGIPKALGAIRTGIVRGTAAAWNAAGRGLAAARTFAGNCIQAARNFGTGIANGIRNAATQAWTATKTFVRNAAVSFNSGMRAAFATGQSTFRTTANVSRAYRAGQFVGKIGRNVVNVVGAAKQSFVDFGRGIAQGIRGTAGQAIVVTRSFNAGAAIGSRILRASQGIAQGATAVWNAAGRSLAAAWAPVSRGLTAVRNFAGSCIQATRNFITGIANGIRNTVTVASSVQMSASYIRGAAIGSRVFRAGRAVAISIRNAAVSFNSGMRAGFATGQSTFRTTASVSRAYRAGQFVGKIGRTVVNARGAVKQSFVDFGKGIAQGIRGTAGQAIVVTRSFNAGAAIGSRILRTGQGIAQGATAVWNAAGRSLAAVRNFAGNCIQATKNFGKGIAAGWKTMYTVTPANVISAAQKSISYKVGLGIGRGAYAVVWEIDDVLTTSRVLSSVRNFATSVINTVRSSATGRAVGSFVNTVRTSAVGRAVGKFLSQAKAMGFGRAVQINVLRAWKIADTACIKFAETIKNTKLGSAVINTATYNAIQNEIRGISQVISKLPGALKPANIGRTIAAAAVGSYRGAHLGVAAYELTYIAGAAAQAISEGKKFSEVFDAATARQWGLTGAMHGAILGGIGKIASVFKAATMALRSDSFFF